MNNIYNIQQFGLQYMMPPLVPFNCMPYGQNPQYNMINPLLYNTYQVPQILKNTLEIPKKQDQNFANNRENSSPNYCGEIEQ